MEGEVVVPSDMIVERLALRLAEEQVQTARLGAAVAVLSAENSELRALIQERQSEHERQPMSPVPTMGPFSSIPT
jgi:hypothetical protein